MAEVNKVKVKIDYDYKENTITITGEGISAVLEITGAELKKMYWGKSGSGAVSAKIS